jgi:hypothetical protein
MSILRRMAQSGVTRKLLLLSPFLSFECTSLQVYKKKKNGAKRCYQKTVTFVTFLKVLSYE